jgi:hypothetical protein
MAANLPFKYMGAVMFGNGICGIGANILRAITLAVFPTSSNDESKNKQNNFYSAVLFLCLGAFILIVGVFI